MIVDLVVLVVQPEILSQVRRSFIYECSICEGKFNCCLLIADPGDADSVHSGSIQSNANSTDTSSKRKRRVKKSLSKRSVSKLDASALTIPGIHNSLLDEIAQNASKAPNLSRKFRGLKLYAFPSFDKCDSLVFFPSTMTRHLNSGDFDSLTSLMNAHLHKNCQVRISPHSNIRLNAPMFVKLFEVMNDAHPDSVMCVHTTKVVENAIAAKMYFKFTDSQVINNSMARTVTDSMFSPMFSRRRSSRFEDNMDLASKSEQERRAITAIVDSEVDLIVYGKIDLKLTFDDTSKKVVGIDFLCEFTSLSTTEIGAVMGGEEL